MTSEISSKESESRRGHIRLFARGVVKKIIAAVASIMIAGCGHDANQVRGIEGPGDREAALNESLDAPKATNDEPRSVNDSEVRAALQKTGNLDFINTPLRLVAGYIEKQYGIPVSIDEKGLEAAGADPSLRITCNLRNTTLSDSLQSILPEHNLTHVVRDGRLVITDAADPK